MSKEYSKEELKELLKGMIYSSLYLMKIDKAPCRPEEILLEDCWVGSPETELHKSAVAWVERSQTLEDQLFPLCDIMREFFPELSKIADLIEDRVNERNKE